MNRVSNVLSTSGSHIEQTLRNLLQRQAPRRENTTNGQNVQVREEEAQQLDRPRHVSIEELTREQIVDEISTLVHRQLVSSALRSDFRSSLERRVMNRMTRIGNS